MSKTEESDTPKPGLDISKELENSIKHEIELIKEAKEYDNRRYFTEYERGRLQSLKLILGWIYSMERFNLLRRKDQSN